MEFKKYQHVERFGTSEVENIELGLCHVFPKLDGTNASLWLDDNGNLAAGSRTRTLTLEKDNAGFFEWALQQKNLLAYLKEHPTHRLYGEWLVPHALKTYREEAWRKFYVFDVCIDKDDKSHEFADDVYYLSYEQYEPLLEAHNIDHIVPICTIKQGNYEQFVRQLDKNIFLIQDGKGVGEGIVIKNYNFHNKYDRQIWAKIVTTEYRRLTVVEWLRKRFFVRRY
jgi:hypothetical protein